MDGRKGQRAFVLLPLVHLPFSVPAVNVIQDPHMPERVSFDPLDYLQLFRGQVDRCAESQESAAEPIVQVIMSQKL